MTGDFKKLIDSVQSDIILIDILYQWANTPTGIEALKKGRVPNHGLIGKNLIVRYELEKIDANNYLEWFKKIVEDAKIDFNTGYNNPHGDTDLDWFFDEYFTLNPVLRLQTLCRLASANERDREIVWLYCKLKNKGLQSLWSSYSDNEIEKFYKSFKKFSEIFRSMFHPESELSQDEIVCVLIKQGFINELEWITSKTDKRSGRYEFPTYLEDIAKNIDNYIKFKTIFV